MYNSLSILACFGLFIAGYAFFLEEKADCVLSPWTNWRQYDYGVTIRERKIMQYPVLGGKDCSGPLLEVKEQFESGTSNSLGALPLPVEATLMIDGFLRPTIQNRRSFSPTALYRDLLIIIDSSSSIGQSEFKQSVHELATLLSLMCPKRETFDSAYNRAALIDFSSSIQEVFDFDDYKTTTDVLNAIRQVKYLGHDTCTGNAFNYAKTMFKTTKGARNDPTVKREVLIITDGLSNCGSNATIGAKNLQTIADVYALVIGSLNATGKAEIASYVSRPISSHLFASNTPNELTNLVVEVVNQLQAKPSVPCAPFYPDG